jgi:hypothetical protein
LVNKGGIMAVKTETTPRKLQILVIAALGGSFAIQWAMTLSTVLQQIQTNSNLSSYTSFFVGQVIVPVLLFAGAYFLNPRRLSRVGKLFESLLIMLAGQILVQTAVQLAMLVHFSVSMTNPDDAYLSFIIYDLVAVGIGLVMYFAALVYLRKTKRWK